MPQQLFEGFIPFPSKACGKLLCFIRFWYPPTPHLWLASFGSCICFNHLAGIRVSQTFFPQKTGKPTRFSSSPAPTRHNSNCDYFQDRCLLSILHHRVRRY